MFSFSSSTSTPSTRSEPFSSAPKRKLFGSRDPQGGTKKAWKAESPLQRRLSVGSGNFSHPLTRCIRRMNGQGRSTGPNPNYASTYICTEYKSEKELLADSFTRNNIDELRSLGASVLFEVDAQNLSKTFDPKQYRFTRIEWGGPDIGTAPYNVDGRLTRTLRNFFQSARTFQRSGDRIHLFILGDRSPFNRDRQAHHYGLVDAIEGTGYIHVDTKSLADRVDTSFEDREYSYEHQKTHGDQKVKAVATEGMREYIFECCSDAHKTTAPSRISSHEGERQKYFGKNRGSISIKVKGNFYNQSPSDPMSEDSDDEEVSAWQGPKRKIAGESLAEAEPATKKPETSTSNTAAGFAKNSFAALMDLDSDFSDSDISDSEE